MKKIIFFMIGVIFFISGCGKNEIPNIEGIYEKNLTYPDGKLFNESKIKITKESKDIYSVTVTDNKYGFISSYKMEKNKLGYDEVKNINSYNSTPMEKFILKGKFKITEIKDKKDNKYLLKVEELEDTEVNYTIINLETQQIKNKKIINRGNFTSQPITYDKTANTISIIFSSSIKYYSAKKR